MTDALDGEIREICSHAISEKVFPGCAIAVRDGDEKREWCFGSLSYEISMPVSRGTLYDIASITKMIVSLAILRLIELEELRLDSLITEFLSFGHADARKVTIRDLLTYSVYFKISKQLQEYEVWMKERKGWKLWRRRFLTEAIPHIAPCDKPAYSNISPLVLGFILERIACAPLDHALKTIVFEPLSIFDTVYHPKDGLSEENAERCIAPTERSIPIGTPHDPLARLFGPKLIAASGLFSTIGDVLKIGELVSAGRTKYGEVFLSQMVHRDMLERHTGKEHSFGFGLGVFKFASDYLQEHSWFTESAGLMTGAPGCLVAGCPRTEGHEKMAVAILSNAIHPEETKIEIDGHPPIYGVRRELIKAFLDWSQSRR